MSLCLQPYLSLDQDNASQHLGLNTREMSTLFTLLANTRCSVADRSSLMQSLNPGTACKPVTEREGQLENAKENTDNALLSRDERNPEQGG